MNIKVSVIIPIYNAEKTLSRCIESVINQSLKEIEIILVNDGSKDLSEEICNNYCRIDSRIKVIHQNNKGVSYSRNAGIKKSIGEYVMFIDSDDYIDIKMLEQMYSIGSDVVVCGYFNEDEKNNVKRINKSDKTLDSRKGDDLDNILMNINLAYTWGKLYKRDIIIENNLFFNTKMSFGEDLVFVENFFLLIKSAVVLNTAYYHFIRSKNTSLSKKYVHNIEASVEEIFKVEKKLQDRYPKYRETYLKRCSNDEIRKAYMCILNNYREMVPLNKFERREYIEYYLQKDELIDKINNKQYTSHNKMERLFVTLYKTNNALLIDIVLYCITKIIRKISFN